MTKQKIFAILGDIHGKFDYAAQMVIQIELKIGRQIDFILQVGDMEAHRDENDLKSMYAPFREKQLGDFYLYANGEKTFPRPLYFIGGNHESYLVLNSCKEGLQIAPNIYFLGRYGKTNIQGINIAFLSGIYDENYYHSSANERNYMDAEMDIKSLRFLSCYVEEEIEYMTNISRPDILLVHEWPNGIVRFQDHENGEPKHRHLRYGDTGTPVIAKLVEKTGPKMVFCGHLHRPYRSYLKNKYGEQSLIYCLGRVGHHKEAIMIFTFDGVNFIEQLCLV
jgi:lariat debranching enzyme